jgi:hypothetical protein
MKNLTASEAARVGDIASRVLDNKKKKDNLGPSIWSPEYIVENFPIAGNYIGKYRTLYTDDELALDVRDTVYAMTTDDFIDFVVEKWEPEFILQCWNIITDETDKDVNEFRAHPDARIRAKVAAYEYIDDESVELLRHDSNEDVLAKLAKNPKINEVVLIDLYDKGSDYVIYNLLQNTNVPRAVVMASLFMEDFEPGQWQAFKRVTEKELLFMLLRETIKNGKSDGQMLVTMNVVEAE